VLFGSSVLVCFSCLRRAARRYFSWSCNWRRKASLCLSAVICALLLLRSCLYSRREAQFFLLLRGHQSFRPIPRPYVFPFYIGFAHGVFCARFCLFFLFQHGLFAFPFHSCSVLCHSGSSSGPHYVLLCFVSLVCTVCYTFSVYIIFSDAIALALLRPATEWLRPWEVEKHARPPPRLPGWVPCCCCPPAAEPGTRPSPWKWE
jgi:hypothetical protein